MSDPASSRFETASKHQIDGVYAEPVKKSNVGDVKRVAKIAAGALLVAILGSFAIKIFEGMQERDSDVSAPQSNGVSSRPQNSETDSAQRPLYVTQSNPEVATISELARPWSSKKFVFQSVSQSKDVSAIIVRLPGPGSESKSYWAFSLEVPFSQCLFAYIDDLPKLASEYGFEPHIRWSSILVAERSLIRFNLKSFPETS